jgi:hypothetical protein
MSDILVDRLAGVALGATRRRQKMSTNFEGWPSGSHGSVRPFRQNVPFGRTLVGMAYVADADTGVRNWRLKSNYPILGGMTPTPEASCSSAVLAATSMRSIPATARNSGVRNSAA